MLLIYPPVAKPCEPPAGLALLAGSLQAHGCPCTTVDLNLESLLHQLSTPTDRQDAWSRRAWKNRGRNLENLRSKSFYTNTARYRKTVLELNRVLENHGHLGETASLANYQDARYSPVNSTDLRYIADHPEENAYHPFYQQRIPALLQEHKPNLIGISINYLSQALPAFALIGCIREHAPAIKIVAGGGLITSWMRRPGWHNPFADLIDYCIDGCGEQPLLELSGKKISQPSQPLYSPFLREKYLSPGFILPYSSSSGCFWNKCSFCPERAEGHVFANKGDKRALAEISLLKEENSPALLHFLDNAIPPALLMRMSSRTPGMPWYGFARVTDHFRDVDFCRNLKASGCVMLKLGIESGDQGVLDRLEKGIDLATVSLALQILASVGIATYVYLLFGTPAEDAAAARKTLEFTRKHHNCISFLNLAIFNMPINTRDAESLGTTSFYTGDLSLYTDFDHPLGWNRKEVRLFLDREFKKTPEINKIIQRDPVIFTSNHAPFFRLFSR